MASVLFISPHLLLCCMDGSLWSTSASPLIALTYASALALVAMIFRMPSAFLFVLAAPSMVYTGYIMKQGRSLNHNDIAAAMNTTLSETTDFIFGSEILVPVLLLLFVWAGLIVTVAIRWTLLSRVLRKLKCIRLSERAYQATQTRLHPCRPTLVGLMVLMVAICIFTIPRHVLGKHYPVNTLDNVHRTLVQISAVQDRYHAQNYIYQRGSEPLPENLTLVFGIGESARAANWQAYGYTGNPTTPHVVHRLENTSDRMVLYKDALASARLTMLAVPSMLSPIPAGEVKQMYDHPAIIRTFNQAGYWTAELSSHKAQAFYSGPVEMILDETTFSRRFQQEQPVLYQHDKGLIDWLPKLLARSEPRKLIFLHFAGSHYTYEERYPKRFAKFTPKLDETMDDDERHRQDRLAVYDNTLLYTDHLLEQVMTAIDERKEPALLFYCSDHGENFNESGDDNFYHSWQPWITGYEAYVPMFIYANKAFAKAYPERMRLLILAANAPLGHDNISHTLLGLANLKDPQVYRKKYDISGKDLRPTPRHTMRWFEEPVPIEEVHKEVNRDGVIVGGKPPGLQ